MPGSCAAPHPPAACRLSPRVQGTVPQRPDVNPHQAVSQADRIAAHQPRVLDNSAAGQPGTIAAPRAGHRPRQTALPPAPAWSAAVRPGQPGRAAPRTSAPRRSARLPGRVFDARMPEQPNPQHHRPPGSARRGRSRLRLQRVHVGRGEAVARDIPVTAVNLLDEDPGDRPEVLASISTIVSVILQIIACFCSCVKTPSITFTVTNGIPILPSSSLPVPPTIRPGRVKRRVTGSVLPRHPREAHPVPPPRGPHSHAESHAIPGHSDQRAAEIGTADAGAAVSGRRMPAPYR